MAHVRSATRLPALALLFSLAALHTGHAVFQADFEDLNIEPGTFWNGSDQAGGFKSHTFHFRNDYNPAWFSWSGIAYSTVNNIQSGEYTNQYAVFSGTGYGDSGTYAIVYDDGFNPAADEILFPLPVCPKGFFINNTTYAALAMRDGNAFAKQFGGLSGDDPDWFMLTVTGKDRSGVTLGETNMYLADYRFADNGEDYIVSEWTWFDLTAIGPGVNSLHFSMSSSDVGIFGVNTPTYFAMDNLSVIPQPACLTVDFEDLPLPYNHAWNGSDESGGFDSSLVAFSNLYNAAYFSWSGIAHSSVNNTNSGEYTNQYAVISGTGYGGTGTYAIVYDDGFNPTVDVIHFPMPALPKGFYINNTTYAAIAMRDGNGFAKKFGGASGNDPDWLKLTVTGKNRDGATLGTTGFYLADFRFSENANDFILNAWTWVDLSVLGPDVSSLHFSMDSTDTGDYGINTPTYFAMDDLQLVYTFSGGAGSDNPFDDAVPGFVGPNGNGLRLDPQSTINPAFAGWASQVVDYSPTPNVSGDWTNSSLALGPVQGTNTGVVSLGELDAAELNASAPPGALTLGFTTHIVDGPGPDFVVFENAFPATANDVFAELGYVDVSSDGTHFARFPSVSLRETAVSTYGFQRPEEIFQLCGKHFNGSGHSWGTPFDLGNLACDALVRNGQVDLQAIRFVRIVDIPGRGDYFDDFSPPNPIYDPWETYLSGGVDVEAVGILNAPSHRHVYTSVTGPGSITPFGAPAGAVAVAAGSNQTFTISAKAGYHVIDVVVDGHSIGPTGEVHLVNITQARHIQASFGSRLIVRSPFGAGSPSVGTHYRYGPMAAAMPQSPIVMGSTQLVCSGWAGTASVPATGAGTATGAFSLTNDSTLTWLWTTNFWLRADAPHGGSVDAPTGWNARGSNAVAQATPHAFFEWSGWTGDIDGDTNQADTVLAMTRPRHVVAHFYADLASNKVPVGWLDANAHTNLPPDEAAMLDRDHDGMKAWEEFFAGTDPNNATSAFAIVSLAVRDGSNCVTWLGGDTGSMIPFDIERRTNLFEPWMSLGVSIARSENGTNWWWGAEPGVHAFYRVVVPTE